MLNRRIRFVVLWVSTLIVTGAVWAQPTLTVSDIGLNGSSNREWLVQAAPDVSLFARTDAGDIIPGSLAAELAFEVTDGTLVSATKTGGAWPFDNVGNDPFSGSVSEGLVVDSGMNTVFAALGTNLFDDASMVDVITIETLGSDATISWGGHTLLGGTPREFVGSRLAQNGINYDGYMGSVSAAGAGLVCDADADGDCDQNDINALYAQFGSAGSLDLDNSGIVDAQDIGPWLEAASSADNPSKANATDVYEFGDVNLNGVVDSTDLGLLLNEFGKADARLNWANGNLNGDDMVDSSDLGLLLNNFGFESAATSAVPEPTFGIGWILATLLAFSIGRRRRTLRS